jgi:hypothetical protein
VLAFLSCVLALIVVRNAMVAFALQAAGATMEINRSCYSCWYLLAVTFGIFAGSICLLFDRPRAHKLSFAAFLFALATYAVWIAINVIGFRTGQVNCGNCVPAEGAVGVLRRDMGWTALNVAFPLLVIALLVCEIALIRREVKAGSADRTR